MQKSIPTKQARSAKIGSVNDRPKLDFRKLYPLFNTPITELDCGQKCAIHNPHSVPFCCDICHASPAAYHSEWEFLKQNTDLWHLWAPSDCDEDRFNQVNPLDDLPENMVLLACLGAQHCQRPYRALSCRQFPFFPYVTEDFRFIGLAYEWQFVQECWIISHIELVSSMYRKEFIQTFDEIFNLWPEEMENYSNKSEEMRSAFCVKKRRIPILHRNGKIYLLSPMNERIRIAAFSQFQKFGPYQNQ